MTLPALNNRRRPDRRRRESIPEHLSRERLAPSCAPLPQDTKQSSASLACPHVVLTMQDARRDHDSYSYTRAQKNCNSEYRDHW